MKCPFCGSHDLIVVENTQCCDDCGGSFVVIQEPQPDLLAQAKRMQNDE